jgi:hypothetical protein
VVSFAVGDTAHTVLTDEITFPCPPPIGQSQQSQPPLAATGAALAALGSLGAALIAIGALVTCVARPQNLEGLALNRICHSARAMPASTVDNGRSAWSSVSASTVSARRANKESQFFVAPAAPD